MRARGGCMCKRARNVSVRARVPRGCAHAPLPRDETGCNDAPRDNVVQRRDNIVERCRTRMMYVQNSALTLLCLNDCELGDSLVQAMPCRMRVLTQSNPV